MRDLDDLALGWAIHPSSIAEQLKHLSELTAVWHQRFSTPEFVGLLERLSAHEREQLLVQFTNEMKMVTSKAATLVEVLT